MLDSELTLHQGDCLEVLPTIPAGSVGMCFCDLPYGVTENRWDRVIPLEPLWEQLLRVGKKNCVYVFTATERFGARLITSQEKLFRYGLVWQTGRPSGFLNAKRRPLRKHESLLIFGYGSLTYNPQKTPKLRPQRHGGVKDERQGFGAQPNRQSLAGKMYTENYPVSVVEFVKEQGCHPTQKPVALLEWLIKTYSNPGDTILDPTMGSGTTGVACVNTGRGFVGIEKDAAYFATCEKRIADASKTPHLETMLYLKDLRGVAP